MKRFLFLLAAGLFLAIHVSGQPVQTREFNFDFEKISDGFPAQWTTFGGQGYTLSVDSLNVRQGKYSAAIASNSDAEPSYMAWSFTIPDSYEGEQITLTGFLKTENVTDGFAGLWMRIDPNVAFDNMNDRGVVGTTDWTHYSITLSLNPAATKQIVVGGLLAGKGKMWIDDLKLTIDGKDIRDLQSLSEKEYPAQKDTEFDAGSGISAIPTDADHVRTLKQLGLIWGFLKYYHPAVAEGNFNWDYELFRIIPKIIDEKQPAKRDQTLVQWIDRLGQITQAAPVEEVKDAKLLPDLGWIDNSGFSMELTAALHRVANAKRTGLNYYVGMSPWVGNPEFKHENPYAEMKYPDTGYRLLSLFRYWNMMQYYNPNRHLIGEDWKNVLEEFIPQFVQAGDETDYVLTTLELIGRVHDTHANLWMKNPVVEKFKGQFFTPPTIMFVDGKAVVTGSREGYSLEMTGLRPGDVITEIDGRKVADIVPEKLKFTPASNDPTQLRNIAQYLLRTNNPCIEVTYSRNGLPAAATLKSHTEEDIYTFIYPKPDSCFRMLDGGIAYLFPGLLKQGDVFRLWPQIKDTKGLIVDMRCYPSDFIGRSLLPMLLPQTLPFVQFGKGCVETPGLFVLQPAVLGEDNPDYYKGRVVALINEFTQSQAEYTTIALKTVPGTIVVGSTTAGADGDISEILLPGGLRTAISGIGVYYPDGRETQRVGIVPDIEVLPTIEGIAQGRDELLEKAVSLINQ